MRNGQKSHPGRRAARPVLCGLGTLLACLPALVAVPVVAGATGSWTTVASMSGGRDWLAAASDGTKVYVAGGEDSGGQPVADVEAYNPATNTWATAPAMTTARSRHALVAAGGKIWAIGGQAGGVPTTGPADMESYTPGSTSWQAVQPQALSGTTPNLKSVIGRSTGRVGLAAVKGSDGRIYAMGGLKDLDPTTTTSPGTADPTNAVEVFDPANQHLGWVALAPMINARSDFGAAVDAAGKIYAVGGVMADPKLVEAYDPATQTWSAVSSMPHAREFGVRAASDSSGRIYVLGGHWGMPTLTEDHTKVVDMYDPSTGSWVAGPQPNNPVPAGAVPPMPSHREWGAATLGPSGKIYALGGAFGVTKLNSVDTYTP